MVKISKLIGVLALVFVGLASAALPEGTVFVFKNEFRKLSYSQMTEPGHMYLFQGNVANYPVTGENPETYCDESSDFQFVSESWEEIATCFAKASYRFHTSFVNYSYPLSLTLQSDLDLGGANEDGSCAIQFVPLSVQRGSTPKDFSFNGGGYTVKNMCISVEHNSENHRDDDGFNDHLDYLGFFGKLDGAKNTITNVTFKNAVVVASSDEVNYRLYAGVVAGHAENISVNGVNVESSNVDASNVDPMCSSSTVGGFFGEAESVSIQKSGIDGSKVLNNEGAAGGLIAYVSGVELKDDKVFVKNVTVSTSVSWVGGVFGYMSSGSLDRTISMEQVTVISNDGFGAVGGLVGEMHSGDAEVVAVSNHKLSGLNLKGRTVGGLVGEVGLSELTVVTLSANNNVVGDMSMGFEGAETGSVMGALFGVVHHNTSSNLATINIENNQVRSDVLANMGSVGGLVGEVTDFGGNSLVNMKQNVVVGNVGSTSTGDAYVGAFVGYVDNGIQLSILNSYSIGSITAGAGARSSTGYLIGYAGNNGSFADNENLILNSNFHYGTDDVALGVGNWDNVSLWQEGSEKVRMNIRNAVTGLAATGILRPYFYSIENATTGSYTDVQTPFALNGTTPVRNGVASDKDMKSGVFAAVLSDCKEGTSNPTSSTTWTYNTEKNEGLPFVWTEGTTGSPIHSILLNVDAVAGDLSASDIASLGVMPEFGGTVTGGVLNGGTSRNLWGVSEPNGKASQNFIDSANALINMFPARSLHIAASGRTFSLNDPVTDSYMMLVDDSRFNVTYQFCDEEGSCADISTLAEPLYSVTPFVSSVSNGNSDLGTFVPAVPSRENPLKFMESRLEILGADGTPESVNATPEQLTNVMFFSSILPYLGEGFSIVVKYSEASVEKGNVLVLAPYAYSVEPKYFALNGSREHVQYGTTGDSSYSFYVPATTVSFDFKDGLGYKYKGSYEASYIYQVQPLEKPCVNEVNCDWYVSEGKIPVTDVVVTGSEFGSYSDLKNRAEAVAPGNAVSWTMKNLTSDSKISLATIASAMPESDTRAVFHRLSLTPEYDAVPYNVMFALPEMATLEDRYNGEFYVDYFFPKDYVEKGTYSVDGEKDFPVVYGSLRYADADPEKYGYSSYSVITKGWSVVNPDNCFYEAEESRYRCDNYSYGNPTPYMGMSSYLLREATEENKIVSVDGEADQVTLSPVWTRRFGGFYDLKVTCVKNNPEDEYDRCVYPAAKVTLSQPYPVSGSSEVAKHVATGDYNSRNFEIPVVKDESGKSEFEFDVDVKPVGGVTLKNVSYEGSVGSYDPVTKKLNLPALKSSDEAAFVLDYELVSYDVRFAIAELGNVMFGDGWMSSYENWTVSDNTWFGYNTSARAYVFDETSEMYRPVLWDLKDRLEDTPLASSGNTSIISVMKGLSQEGKYSSFYSNAKTIPLTIVAQDFQGNLLDTKESYHGSVTLSQSIDDGTGTLITFPHESELQPGWQHVIDLPVPLEQRENFTFDVTLNPDPGYEMLVTDYDVGGGIQDNTGSYVNAEGEFPFTEINQLVFVPFSYGSIKGELNFPKMTVLYTPLDYNVNYAALENTDTLFVASVAEGKEGGWNLPKNETIQIGNQLVKVFTPNGCLAGWKVDVDSWHADSAGSDTLSSYMVSLMTAGKDGSNSLVLDRNKLNCSAANTGYYTLTLDSDKNGTLEMYQVIGSGTDKVYIKHEFVQNEMRIPKIFNDAGEEVGVKLMAVAKPSEEYTLKDISVDYELGGYNGNFVGQDSMILDIKQNQTWHVTFSNNGPYFVKYNLELDEADSSKVFFPADANAEQSLVFDAALADEDGNMSMWAPVHTGKCFVGWSLKPADKRKASDDLYNALNKKNMVNLSSDENARSILYAVWKDRSATDADCLPIEPNAYENVFVAAAKRSGTEYVPSIELENGHIEIYQEFDDAVFVHNLGSSAADSILLPYNEKGYPVFVSAVADAGYETSDVNLIYYHESSTSTAIDPVDDVYLIGDKNYGGENADNEVRFVFSATFASTDYNIAFQMGSAEKVMKTSSWIDTLDAVSLSNSKNLFEMVARTDACFEGWAFTEDATSGFTYTNEAFFAALKKATAQVIAEADEENDVPEKKGYFLYPVWKENCTPTLVRVKSDNALGEGTFVLKQGSIEIPVIGDGVDVPANVLMSIDFVDGTGVSHDASAKVSAIAYDGNDEVVELPENEVVVGTDGFAFLGGNGALENSVEVKYYVLKMDVTFDGYEITFDVNAGDNAVFYEEGWSKKVTFKMDQSDLSLPMVYRADAKLIGWAFETTQGANTYKEFNKDVIETYKKNVTEENKTVVLHAIWDESVKPATYTVLNGSIQKGSLTLVRPVDGVDEPYNAGESGLKIPVDAPLNFQVYFNLHSGYAGTGLQLYDLMGNKIGDAFENEDEITVSGNIVVTSLAASTPYTFAFDVNAAGCTNMFYGKNWVSEAGYDLDANNVLPTNVYCTDKILAGWKLSHEDGTAPHVLFDESVHEAADTASTNGNSLTLTAVWKTPAEPVETVTIKSANLTEGTMSVAQMVNGDITKPVEVGSAGVVVPVGDGDVELLVSFDYGTGYSKTEGFFTAVNDDQVSMALNYSGDWAKLAVSENVAISAPVTATEYTIAFDVNATGVFYNELWKSTGKYSLAMAEKDMVLPTAFRADACLEGWSLEKVSDELASDAQKATVFDDEYLLQNLTASSTLYAVWNTDCNRTTVQLRLKNPMAGAFSLTQNVEGKLVKVAESVDGEVFVPNVQGMTFTVDYVVNAGFSAQNGSAIQVENSDGILENLDNNVLVLDGADVVALSIPAEPDDEFTVVFSENTSAKVFYGEDWVRSGSFKIGGANSKFPKNLYRTDAEWLGWAFSPRSTKRYTEFNEEFVRVLKAQKELGNAVDTLYASWNEYGLFDNVRITTTDGEPGRFSIYQDVYEDDGSMNEKALTPISVGVDGVLVPKADEGLKFHVEYEPAPGYSLQDDGFEKEITVLEDYVLEAYWSANTYRFVFDVNDSTANIFYGDRWRKMDAFTMASREEFPTTAYQAGKVIAGWSLSRDGSGGYSRGLNERMVAVLEEDKIDTLYAVWESSDEPFYHVSFANSEVGTLTLSQIVGQDTNRFVVGANALRVPVVDEGFQFQVDFKPAPGFIYDAAKDTLAYTGVSEMINGRIVVNNNVTFSLPLVAEGYKIAFNVNSDRNDVIYGYDWIAENDYSAQDSVVKSLPKIVYTSDACVIGWSVGQDTAAYTEFSAELIDAVNKSFADKKSVVLNARWKDADACLADEQVSRWYNRVTMDSRNGSVDFLELRENGDSVVHAFAKDNTMLLPVELSGLKLVVRSYPDSSFMLNNVVMTRANDTTDVYSFIEGGSLVLNLHDAMFTANFVKSNKTPLAVENIALEQSGKSGSAIRLTFSTSAFEVTRNVKARAYVVDASANVVADTTFENVIAATPAEFSWVKYPFGVGEYTVVAEIFDADTTAFADTSFTVMGNIEVVSNGGWQMVSMAAVDTAAIIWDDDPAFYWWDEQDETGEFWQYKSFEQGDEIIAERGYWYSTLEGRTLPINPDAKSVEGDTKWVLDSVYSGWNLVANPYGWSLNLFNDNRDKLCAVDEECEVSFYTYNPETGEYEDAVTLAPFEAVWASVGKNTTWNLKGEPSFASDMVEKNPEIVEIDSVSGAATKRRVLAKANALNSWSLQAVLTDNRGKKDSWNILGVSSRPFVSEEPPAAQGDHVNLSVMDGKKALTKSFKPVADSYEWQLALSATSDRIGNLTLVGVNGLRNLGYHVFVTVEGKTVEMNEGESVRVALKSRETMATVRVTAGSLNVVANILDCLNMSQTPGKVHVGFNVDESLAGSRTVVDIVNLDGKVLATFSSKAQAGRNILTMDAPRSGLYMLRVRVASQQIAGKIMVK